MRSVLRRIEPYGLSLLPLLLSAGTPAGQAAASAAQAGSEGDSVLLWWVVGLFVLGMIFGALELFIPSMGMLSVLAALCTLGSIAVAFRIGPGTGASVLALVLVSAPLLAWAALKVFPSTPIGRHIILNEGTTEEDFQRRSSERAAEAEAITLLIGARGKALTDLRPGGTVRIEGEDVEAFAEAGMIRAGTDVQISTISGRQIKVVPTAPPASTSPTSAA